jgi:general secretion pathway protein N
VRLDAAGPRTWLLGALAGGAVVAWMLALAGRGGRIDRLPVDPSMTPPLPPAAAAAPERLGPLAQYAEIGNRPLFTADRRPKPFSLNGQDESGATQTFDYVLTGVIQTPALQLAVLQPSMGGEAVRVRVGEAPEGAAAWQLVAVHPRSAVFAGPEGEQVLDMRVWDGVGGAPPSQSPAPNTSAQPTPDATSATGPAPTPVPVGPGRVEPVMEDDAPAVESADADPPPGAEDAQARMDAIRRRIEARREQLRREAQSQPPAGDADRRAPATSPPNR